MATTPVPTQNPAVNLSPAAVILVAVPSDPASAAAFAAGNLFVFLCTPAGQKLAVDAESAGKAVEDIVKGLAQDVVDIFRGIHL
jgi:hypothetical protein